MSIPPPGQGPIDPRGTMGGSPQMPPGGFGGGYPPMPQMPPMMPPPMYPPPYPPQYPPPQKGGFARAILTTLATSILLGSISLNIYLLLFSAVFHSGTTSSDVLIEGAAEQTIAVIPLEGAIDDRLLKQFSRFVAQAERDANVKAIVVEINSPGGEMTPSDEMYRQLKKLKERKGNLPIVISMRGIAASGGYYVACAGDYIFAQDTTWTGSIGVYILRLNMAGLMEKWGLTDNTSIGGNAPYKYAGSSTREETEAHKAYFQDLADVALTQFKGLVNGARQTQLSNASKRIDDVADGRVFSGPTALKLGLVDKIGYLDDACNEAATRAGLSNKRVVRYIKTPSFFEALSGESSMSGGSRGGVQINVDGDLLRQLSTPKVMYLWRGE